VTSDIHLRPFDEPDLALFVRFSVDRSLSEPFSWHGFRSPDEFRRRWVEDGFLGRSPHFLAIADAEGRAIGWVTWRENERPGPGAWEIGALVVPDRRGEGVGTIAQSLLVEHLFETTTAHRIWAGTETTNVAEQRALEKCGFRREGVLRSGVFRAGRWRDSVVFARLREDPAP
jgi:RimJ/RimL family protein N-acetyltransferase